MCEAYWSIVLPMSTALSMPWSPTSGVGYHPYLYHNQYDGQCQERDLNIRHSPIKFSTGIIIGVVTFDVNCDNVVTLYLNDYIVER